MCSSTITKRFFSAVTILTDIWDVACPTSQNYSVILAKSQQHSDILKTLSLQTIAKSFFIRFYLSFLKGAAASVMLSILRPSGNITLLLFRLTNELLFSLAKASCLALFLHSVVNRFFTALSVLHLKNQEYQVNTYFSQLNAEKYNNNNNKIQCYLPAWNHLGNFCPSVTKNLLSLQIIFFFYQISRFRSQDNF